MFGFTKKKEDEKLLEEKCLRICKRDFEKWLQDTYEALTYEQLECVSEFAKKVYNIDDEELESIISKSISPCSRGKRRELNLYEDACLMNKEDLDLCIKSIIDNVKIPTKTIQMPKVIFDTEKLKVGMRVKYFENWTRYEGNSISGINEIECTVREINENSLTLIESEGHIGFINERDVIYHNIYKINAEDSYKIKLMEEN